MKVLLNDGLEREGIELLQQAGIETDTKKRDPKNLAFDIAGFDALIVRSATKVTREIIEAGAKGRLKIVGRAGVGYDNIDVEAASEFGVVVKSAPSGNTNAVAELTIALMLNLSRHVPQAHLLLKQGLWAKEKLKGTELMGKTLGVLGCGKIGQRVAELAHHGFDMDVIGYDICQIVDSKVRYVPKEDVFSNSDYITIHTGGKSVIVGEKELAMIKPTAYLINTSRGANVDEKALYKALKEKKIAGAALDVYSEEPKGEGVEFKTQFTDLDNVILSAHLGASTAEAQRETAIEMAKVISSFLLSGDFQNAVNAGERIELEEKAIYTLFIHHRDVPGVFANIDKVLADNDINIRANYSRQIGKGGYALSVYVIHKNVSPKIIEDLKKIPNVCDVKT